VVSANTFGSAGNNNTWLVHIGPQNSSQVAGIADTIVENNRCVRSPSVTSDIELTGRRLTHVGNVRADGGALHVGFGAHGESLPPDWLGPYYSSRS